MITRIRHSKNEGLGIMILTIFALAGLIKFLGHEATLKPTEADGRSIELKGSMLDMTTVADVKKAAW